jgi:hypothetical protein
MLTLGILNYPSVPISTATLAASTNLIQILPVPITIVDSDFLPGVDTSRDKHNALQTHPREALILRIRQTRMVDETCEVAFAALEDLICGSTVD